MRIFIATALTAALFGAAPALAQQTPADLVEREGVWLGGERGELRL